MRGDRFFGGKGRGGGGESETRDCTHMLKCHSLLPQERGNVS